MGRTPLSRAKPTGVKAESPHRASRCGRQGVTASRPMRKASGSEAPTKGSFGGVKDCPCAEDSVLGRWANPARVGAVRMAGRGLSCGRGSEHVAFGGPGMGKPCGSEEHGMGKRVSALIPSPP